MPERDEDSEDASGFARWRKEVSPFLRAAITLAVAATIVVLVWCYIYRFPVGALLLAIVSLTTFCTQIVETHHDWSGYNSATKKTSRFLVLSFLVVTALYAILNAKTTWENRPRQIDRITEWRMSRDLAKFRGTSVQVVASGLGNYSEACNLKNRIERILQGAGWVTQFGECNRFPGQFGSTLIIQYDTRGQDAGLALYNYLVTQGWPSTGAGITPNRGPMMPAIGVTPFNGDSGQVVKGAKPIDVLVQVYDNIH